MTRSTDAPSTNTAQTTGTSSTGPVNLSVGSGIALTGIWLISAALTVFLLLFCFTDTFDSSPRTSTTDASSTGYAVAFCLAIWLSALPCIGAYKLSKMIIGEKE